jgi:hypothetical protein
MPRGPGRSSFCFVVVVVVVVILHLLVGTLLVYCYIKASQKTS